MHSGYGYVRNYYSGLNILPLEEDVLENYGPHCARSGVRLNLARRRRPRDTAADEQLLGLPGVSGLVFGSFRRENQEAVAADR